MMKILIFIFLLCHVSFLKCIDLPEFLQCVDDSCNEQISTGRVIKSTNPIHGNLGFLKALSKIKIRGKNVTPENTLWLIEQEGNYGFLDSSFIKENVNNVNFDITSVKNPYYKKIIDETEDDEDSSNETKLFSKGRQVKTNDKSIENDETENFSEDNNNSKKETHKTGDVISEKSITSNTSTDRKSDSDNTNVNNDMNNKSEPVNSYKPQVDKNNAFENDTIKNVKEAQESKDYENILENKEKNTDTISNTEIQKNVVQDEKEIKHPSENVKIANQDKNKESLNLQNKEIKHEEIKESKQNILQNKDFVKDDDSINKQAQVTNGNGETVINKEIHSEGNVSQIPIKAKETHVITPENIDSDLKSDNKLTNKSTESKNSNTQLPNEKLGNVESNEQKNLISVNPNEPLQKSVENSQSKDIKLQNDKPVENVNEKNVETKHGNSNNLVPNRSETVNTNEKLTNISSGNDNSETIENEKSDKMVDNSKNLENIPKESIKSLNTDSQSNSVHSKQDEKLNKENIEQNNISLIKQEELSKSFTNDEKLHQKSENSIFEPIGSDLVKNLVNDKQTNEISDEKEQENKKNEALFESDQQESEKISEPIIPDASKASKNLHNNVPIKESVDNDPWFQNNGKSSFDNEKEVLNQIKSPLIKFIMKLDHVSQIIIKSITRKLGFDSSSKFSQFTNYWFQMSLENFVSIFMLFSVLFFVVYTPKLLKFNRDWKSEFLKQSQLIKELESKLLSIEEVRHKLTVQNHNFEKVIDEYKQQINEIQEDAVKNKKALLLEVEKIKKTNELNIKTLTTDLTNKIQQCQILENDIVNKTGIIDNLEEEKKQTEISIENDKSEFERRLLENKRELNKMLNSNEQMKHLLQQSSIEIDQLKDKLQELTQNLIDKNQALSQLENSFEQLKLFEGLNFEEYNEKKAIYLDLTNTKQQLESAKENIEQLTRELNRKSDLITQLEEDKSEMSKKMIDFENQKVEAVNQKDAAEMKLNVLSEYFKSKEVEMAKTLGHQVIESTQSMDQVDYLKHRIQILETENEDMLKRIQKLKLEVKEAQTFSAKCKSDANEEINKLFIKCSNLERSLLTESDENKKLRIKLSRYCGPTPPRNQSSTFNHNTKDRPPSRQSGFSESVGTFAPLPFIPFMPQSPTPNNSQYSGRNSVNSKKSNNT